MLNLLHQMQPTTVCLVLPIVLMVALLLNSVTTSEEHVVERLIAEDLVGLDSHRTDVLTEWLSQMSGVVSEAIVLNPRRTGNYLSLFTERRPGDVFQAAIDAVYLPREHSLILSRGLVDLGTNCVNTSDFTEDRTAVAEDTEGYQLFVFVLLHELGHSKLHRRSHGFFCLTGNCKTSTALEMEADSFAATHVLDAPYGYAIWYGHPESGFESEEGYAVSRFHRLLSNAWRDVELPASYGDTGVGRTSHLEGSSSNFVATR